MMYSLDAVDLFPADGEAAAAYGDPGAIKSKHDTWAEEDCEAK